MKKREQGFYGQGQGGGRGGKEKLLDDAEADGRIDATTRPVYENLLSSDRENGEKALRSLKPKKRVTTDLRVEVGGESPWDKRMSEIKNKLNR